MQYELLIDVMVAHCDQTRESALQLIHEALAVGFGLGDVAQALRDGGTDTLIVNTWTRKTFPPFFFTRGYME